MTSSWVGFPRWGSTTRSGTSTCASSGTGSDRSRSRPCPPEGLAIYGRVCGWTLARAHARSGDRIAIASYLGSGKSFDRAIADFSERYADQNELYYAKLADAAERGDIEVERDLV